MTTIQNKKIVSFIFLLLLLGLLLYSWRVLGPAARNKKGFAPYYTMAAIAWRTPADMPHAYEPPWFQERMVATGFATQRDIYGPNPPTLGFMLGPLLILSVENGAAIWAGLNLLALIAGVYFLLAGLTVPFKHALWVVPLLAVTQPISHHFDRGQLYLILFLGLSIVFWGILQNRPGWAGLSFGLILTAKTAGIWLFLLLAWQRQWQLLLVTIATAVTIILSTLFWFGLTPWLTYSQTLWQLTSEPNRMATAYQTSASLWGQLFNYNAQWNPDPVVNFPLAATLLTAVTFLATFSLSAWLGQLNSPEFTKKALSLALFISLIVVNVPIAEEYHYVLIIPAGATAVWYAAQSKPGFLSLLILGTAILLLTLNLPFKSPLLSQSWLALLAYPRVYGAFLLWGWLLVQLLSRNKRNKSDSI